MLKKKKTKTLELWWWWLGAGLTYPLGKDVNGDRGLKSTCPSQPRIHHFVNCNPEHTWPPDPKRLSTHPVIRSTTETVKFKQETK